MKALLAPVFGLFVSLAGSPADSTSQKDIVEAANAGRKAFLEGNYLDAENTFRDLSRRLESIRAPAADRVSATTSLAQVLLSEGRLRESEDLFNGALQAADREGVPPRVRVALLSSLSSLYMETGRSDRAEFVLKEALPGILTGVILGLERAAGETAPILFTGAAFFLPRLPHSPFDATMALPYHLFVIATQVPEMPIQIQYGTALVLLVFVLTMNLIATIIRSRARSKRQW